MVSAVPRLSSRSTGNHAPWTKGDFKQDDNTVITLEEMAMNRKMMHGEYMMNDGKMGAGMQYADMAVASRCGDGMKPCDGRCIPQGAICHSTDAKKKGNAFSTGAKIAAVAGAAGVSAVGFRNRKAIGEGIKEAYQGTKADLKKRGELGKAAKQNSNIAKEQRKKAAIDRDEGKERIAGMRERIADSRQAAADRAKAEKKKINPLGAIGRASKKVGGKIVRQAEKDLRLS